MASASSIPGDVSDAYNEDQLQLIGHVDILLQVIGGVYTAGPVAGKKIVEQLKPKIGCSHALLYNMGHLEKFVDGPLPGPHPECKQFYGEQGHPSFGDRNLCAESGERGGPVEINGQHPKPHLRH